jgi:acid phosphatase type 7
MRCLGRLKTVLLLCCLACFPSSALAQSVVVMPYVQSGHKNTTNGSDSKILHWFTDQTPGEFTLEFQLPNGPWRNVTPARIALDFPALKVKEPAKKEKPKELPGKSDDPKKDEKKESKIPLPPEKDQHYFKYTAHLDNLPLNAEVRYRVKVGERTIREGAFRTQASADRPVRCVLVGDLAQGRPQQRAIAWQMSLQKPDFLVALGDIVYPTGRVNQYMHFYFGTYNDVPEADPKVGAPLMASVPFYPLLGNHDISAKLAKVPDALGVYYFFSAPKNGPGEGPWATRIDGDEAANSKFRAANKDSYPFIDVYSFDNGPAHFVVLNVNPMMNLDDPTFRKWLIDDLRNAKGRWKIVCFHMPGFHSSIKHYAEQQVRPLSPLFEEAGVTLTFAGHVHNYQRSVPLKFAPNHKQEKKKSVDGRFTLDTAFDGVNNTRPNGVIHIVAGGGGANLYGPGLEKTKETLQKQFGANYADFTAKMVTDQHSFTVLECAPSLLELRALSTSGEELDRIVITK